MNVIHQYINVGSNPNEGRTKIQKCQLKQLTCKTVVLNVQTFVKKKLILPGNLFESSVVDTL